MLLLRKALNFAADLAHKFPSQGEGVEGLFFEEDAEMPGDSGVCSSVLSNVYIGVFFLQHAVLHVMHLNVNIHAWTCQVGSTHQSP